MTQQKPIFSTSHYVKGKHIESPAELRNNIRHSKVTKYAVRNTTMSCDGGALSVPSPRLGSARLCLGSYGNGLRSRAQNVISFFFCDVCGCQCCLYLWNDTMFSEKKKTNILNMFTENCLLYIHIIIYLFYSQCALHNQDIGFVAFCPCSHPNCCSLFVKTFTDVGL